MQGPLLLYETQVEVQVIRVLRIYHRSPLSPASSLVNVVIAVAHTGYWL